LNILIFVKDWVFES